MFLDFHRAGARREDVRDRLVGECVRLDRDQRRRLGLDAKHVPVAADDELLVGLVRDRDPGAVEVVVDFAGREIQVGAVQELLVLVEFLLALGVLRPHAAPGHPPLLV